MSVHWIVIDNADELSAEDEEAVEIIEEFVETPEAAETPETAEVPEEPAEVVTPTDLEETEVVISEPYRLPEGLVLIPEE